MTPKLLGLSLPLVAIAYLCWASGGGSPDEPVRGPLTGAQVYARAGETPLASREPEEFEDLHNVFVLSDNIISGSEPHGASGLKRVADLGVKTVLSVDGKVPDVAIAQELGMRYVHVPIQYKGITPDELMRIAKTFRELEGPFFVHCYHGRHRGPAAAAFGRLILDGATREQAVAEMRQYSGTSDKYTGLYAAVASQEIPSAASTSAFAWDFPGEAKVQGMRHAMSELARIYGHLADMAKRDWTVDPAHPDIVALNEATMMAKLFEDSVAFESVKSAPEPMRRWMGESLDLSRTLVRTLDDLDGAADRRLAAAATLKEIRRVCLDCHAEYRNK